MLCCSKHTLYKLCIQHVYITEVFVKSTGMCHKIVPLLRDHKKSPQKWSLKIGMPYLVGNQELKPLVSVSPNKASLRPFYEVTFVVSDNLNINGVAAGKVAFVDCLVGNEANNRVRAGVFTSQMFYLKTDVLAALQQPLSMLIQKLQNIQTLNNKQTKSTVMGSAVIRLALL